MATVYEVSAAELLTALRAVTNAACRVSNMRAVKTDISKEIDLLEVEADKAIDLIARAGK